MRRRPAPRGGSRLAQRKRERGRQTTAILVTPVRRAFSDGARVRWLAVPRVRSHRQRAFGPTLWRETPGLRIRTVGGCAPRRSDAERRCATGVRAVRCRSCTASSPRPRHLRRALPRDRRMIAKSALPQPGTGPAPRQTLSCCVPLSGKAARSMGEVWRVGISLLLGQFQPGPS